MYNKIIIKANLTVLTGMHIGGSNIFSSIGSVDSPVAKDAYKKQPYIPGSSLKGKLRTLLARSMKQSYIMEEPNKDEPIIRRMFGSSLKGNIQNSRFQFSDAFIKNMEELRDIGTTEVKFENTINRTTAVANPRQIERVIRGVKFDVVIVYDIVEKSEITEDFTHLAHAMKLLQMDYLGGHGTRGYGKVKFSGFNISPLEKATDTETAKMVGEINDIFKEVEKYELLSLQN